MKYKTILFVILLIGIVIVAGCTKSSSQTGYATYNPQGQQPSIGGGCGVAPADSIGGVASASSISTSDL